ncbi:TRAM domain-containing protein (plasmid) [Halorientalis pallida]|uniref:TRAM domain-containing protein n=1 Tax=Halorientalis pallida TaxID=2479928 RepID=UPI003C6F9B36
MVEISDSLQLLFETSLEKERDRYTISIPPEIVENGSLSEGQSYRVALLPGTEPEPESESTSSQSQPRSRTDKADQRRSASNTQHSSNQAPSPPVEEGEIRSVTIDTLGDQGDGIAKVERGFIVIVSGTQPGDQAKVRITDVKENVAFAEPIGDPAVR